MVRLNASEWAAETMHMETVDAIHVALIDGLAVRFYVGPSGGTDDPPWVALPDLHRAMGQPQQDLVAWTELLADSEGSRTVLSHEGPIQIVSHVVASSVTARLVSSRRAPLSLVHQYGVGFSGAADALLARLPPLEASIRKQKWLSESFDFGNAPRPPLGGKLS